jgi:AcrR family transcriptional regulator
VTSTHLSPRKTPVQARAVETRGRILAAAARVFSRHGYAAGTTNRIAAEAGLSIGSLYQYFPNKDAILVELVRDHVAEGATAVGAALGSDDTPTDGDLAGQIRRVVDATVEVHAGDPGLHQVLFEQAPRPPELLTDLRRLEDVLVADVTERLAVHPDVRVTDVTTAAHLAVVTIESVVHRTVATRDRRVEPDVLAAELTAMVVGYLTAASAPTGIDAPAGAARQASSRTSSNRSVEK